MNLHEVLKEKQPAIVKAWFESVLQSYHADARGPMRRVHAQFANPVGFTFEEGLNGLFDALLGKVIPDGVSSFLESIIRIRAVQDFTPSEALSFVFEVKGIVRAQIGAEQAAEPGMQQELTELDRVADEMALYAFDIYMRCREKIYDLKAQEARNSTFRLIQQANRVGGKQE